LQGVFHGPPFPCCQKATFFAVPPRCLNHETTESEPAPVVSPTSPP